MKCKTKGSGKVQEMSHLDGIKQFGVAKSWKLKLSYRIKSASFMLNFLTESFNLRTKPNGL